MRALHLEGFVATGLSWLTRVLAHHDPNAAQGAEGIRAWLGESWVHQFSVTFHATGALLVAGGLAAILLMRTLSGGAGGGLWSDRTRANIRMAVLGGWGLNFLGGVMRLYEPDHPGLTSIGEVAWVQVLVLKHVALVGAVLFSLLAIEMGPDAWTRRLRQHAAIALVLVLVASVSGGVATGLPLPSMGTDMDMDEGAAGQQGSTGAVVTWRNSTMDFTGANPLTPRTQVMQMEVVDGLTEIWAGIEWQNEQSQFWIEVFDPEGRLIIKSGNVSATSAEVTVDKDLVAGTWEVRVRSNLALNDAVAVTSRVTEGTPGLRVLEETVSVAAPSFFELNFYMDPGEYFEYEWSVASGDPAVTWDIHSHPDGDVVIHHEGVDQSGNGTFVAGPNEIYSIYWSPPAGETVTLTYRVEGNFTVHSIYR